MFMSVMFALIDLVVIGIFYAVYGTKRTYSEGMLLGRASAAERSGERGSNSLYGTVSQKYEDILCSKM